MKDGEVIFTADEATGGTHMTLVLAGFLKKSFEEAEEYKKDKKNENDVFTIVNKIYVVGGACCFDEFATVFKKEINVDVVKPIEPLLVTPLGIAMNCNV